MNEPCTCETCRHIGKNVQRQLAVEKSERLGQPMISEAELAEQWHAYAPDQRRVVQLLPQRAAYLSYRARRTGVLSSLIAWNDGDNGEGCDWSEESNIAVLAGPPGTGKTVAAVCLAMHRLATEDPFWISAGDLARRMTLWRTAKHAADRDRMLEHGVLFIDDLGVEVPDRKFAADLDELVDHFYQGYQQLVITTNCAAKEFRERYGRRVIDRLAERGAWITAHGPSMRGGGK